MLGCMLARACSLLPTSPRANQPLASVFALQAAAMPMRVQRIESTMALLETGDLKLRVRATVMVSATPPHITHASRLDMPGLLCPLYDHSPLLPPPARLQVRVLEAERAARRAGVIQVGRQGRQLAESASLA